MTWRDRLQKASFRGVPFKVREVPAEIGRRNATHEYPQRDDAFVEDLGRMARKFTMEAVVVGADYDKQRDALEAALEAPGPGVLIHPTRGRLTVCPVGPVRVSESLTSGAGLASFSITFVQTTENNQPSVRPDTQSRVNSAALETKAAIAGDFSKTFTTTGKPGFVASSAIEKMRGAIAAIDASRKYITPDMTLYSEFMGALSGTKNSLGSLVGTPGTLARSMMALFDGVSGLSDNPLNGLDSMRSLFSHDAEGMQSAASASSSSSSSSSSGASVSVTPSRKQEALNTVATAQLVQRTATVQAVKAASAMSFDSYDQAAAVRDDLASQIDALVEVDAPALQPSERLYFALVRLRVEMVRDINARGADLSRVRMVSLPATLPALVAAHRVYGDATRADELVSRNAGRVKHPGFVPGGVGLEVAK